MIKVSNRRLRVVNLQSDKASAFNSIEQKPRDFPREIVNIAVAHLTTNPYRTKAHHQKVPGQEQRSNVGFHHLHIGLIPNELTWTTSDA